VSAVINGKAQCNLTSLAMRRTAVGDQIDEAGIVVAIRRPLLMLIWNE
jgi:hypothetical protein